MTIRQSTGLRDFVQDGGSLRQAFEGGKLEVYSGSQPSSADAAPTGTLLCTFTDASGAHTLEVQATGTITITGTSGTITGITVGGLQILGATVTWTTSNSNTASLIAAQINKYHKNILLTASANSNVVTLTAKRGLGAAANGLVVTTTESGGDISGADVNIGSAVAGVTSVNGLAFDPVASALLAKRTGQTWSGLGVNGGGTAGWFRLKAATADADALSTTHLRLDGSIATSGADMNSTSTALAADATHTVNQFSPTEPANA